MTEKETEIDLAPLAMKFAGGDKTKKREWHRTLLEAAKAGTLEARAVSVNTPRMVKKDHSFVSHWQDWQGIGETAFAGMPARMVAKAEPSSVPSRLSYRVTAAAVAAWLTKLPEEARKDIHAAGWVWLGGAWPVVAAAVSDAKPIGKPTERGGNEKTRIAAILDIARTLEYDPMCIPWGGKSAIKSECLKLAKDPHRFTSATFDKAWKAASKSGCVAVQDKETYLGK